MKPYFPLIITLTLVMGTTLRSQDRTADSLRSLADNAASDTAKARLLNEIARYYITQQIDSAYVYNQRALDLFKGPRESDLNISLLETEGTIQYEKANYRQAMSIYNTVMLLQSAMDLVGKLPKTYNRIGSCYFFLDNLDSSLAFFNYSLSVHRQSNNPKGISESLNNIGIVLMYKGDYPEAIQNLLESAKIDEDLGNEEDVAKAYNNIGMLYDDLDDFAKASEYYLKSLEIRRRLNLKKGLYSTLNNLGVAYKNRKMYDEALQCLYEAVELGSSLGYRKGLELTYSNIGLVLSAQNKPHKALDYFNRSLEISNETDDSLRVSAAHVNLADAYRKMNDYDRALEHIRTGINIMQSSRYMKNLVDAYAVELEIYAGMGSYRRALETYRTYSMLKDSIFNLEKQARIADIQTRYETEKRENEILILKEMTARQEKDKAVAELKLANRKRWIYGLALGLVALAFLAMYFLQRNKRIEKAKRDALIIRERELGLKAVIDAQEEERKRIAKDLHDGIGQQLSGLKMGWQVLRNKLTATTGSEDEQLDNLSRTLDEAARDLRTISHQMMPRVLNESGLVPAMEDMLEKSFGNGSIHYRFEHFGMENRYPENVEISIYRIAQELVNNIIKHSGASEASIQLFKNNNLLVLIMEDNGVGFDASMKGEGIGLMNIKSRLNTIHGEVNYEPSPGSGTVATIRVPLPESAIRPSGTS